MAPAAVVILALIIYTGFAIPITNMHPWFRWINYIDPVSYAFEALMINEVSVEWLPLTYLADGASSIIEKLSARHSSQLVQDMRMLIRCRRYALLPALQQVPTLSMETLTSR